MAGLIPQAFIDELIQRSDIVEFIDSHIPLKKQGNAYVACCPFHNEKTPSFNVVAKKQFYHCFGCSSSGNVIGFAMAYLNLGFVDAIELLAARLGMEVPRSTEDGAKRRATGSLYQLLEEVSLFYRAQLKQYPPAIDYLKQRGIRGDIAKTYELGYAPDGWHVLEKQFKGFVKPLIDSGMLIHKEDGKCYDRYRGRIIFPIRDRNGRLIGFGGRALLAEQKPKYLNSPETAIFQKNRELYGLYPLLQHNPDVTSLIVVEGYMDVIALAQHGIPNAVAALGTATSTYHIQLLARYCKRIIFCFDGDNAGQQAAWRALEQTLPQMHQGIDARFVFLPQGYDPDSYVQEYGRDALLRYFDDASSLDQFLFQQLSQSIDTHSLAGKTQLLNALQPYLQKLNDSPFKTLLLEELARRTRIEQHRIRQWTQAAQTSNTPSVVSRPFIQRTPLRLAVALLIQYPELALPLLEPINLSLFDNTEHKILKEVIVYIKAHPHCSTAMILEHWRNDNLSASLHKLAAWDHLIPEQTVSEELHEILKFLQRQRLEVRISELLTQSRQQQLAPEEKQELQHLLRLKAGLSDQGTDE
ncbi:MAG: DNA primase [Legionellaceae bacterium]|nr:DNA primase [Legionellaceae bacterium]